MSIRRLLRILLAVAVITPVALFVRQEWRDSQICDREFGSEAETSQYEICAEYGSSPEVNCPNLERSPFGCSETYIDGHRKLVAARHDGLYVVRRECAVLNKLFTGGCSSEQWDDYCSQRHGGRRELPRCRGAGPDGAEGRPAGTLQAKVSAAVGPRSGPRPDRCGTLTIYELPGARPGGVAVAEDGSVWFTEGDAGSLSHMTVDGKVTRRFVNSLGVLALASDGDLWVADNGTNSIWQISPGGGEPRRHAIPTTTGRQGAPFGSGVSDITVAPDGTVWFVETEADQVGRLTPDGRITEIPLFGPGDGFMRPSSISAAPDGSVWVSAGLARRLARIDGRNLSITQFPVPVPKGSGTANAASVAADADGNVWFEQPSGSAMDPKPLQPGLGRMDRRGEVTFHPLPSAGIRWPGPLTAGPDGAIWFLDAPAKAVGRMAPNGTLTEFASDHPDVTSGGGEGGLAAGTDSLWFAQPQTNSLGRISCS